MEVSWLPPYHDMGLIGAYLSILYGGGSGVYTSPAAFIKNPPLWMELASAYKATHTQAPSFAYALAARKFESQQAGCAARGLPPTVLDLSAMQHMFNAAEPIDPAACAAFRRVYGAHGLRPGALVPGYGLAEHTVYVCDGGRAVLRCNKRALEVDGTVVLVKGAEEAGGGAGDAVAVLQGCGKPDSHAAIDIRIVNPDTCAEVAGASGATAARVGEVWVSSPSKALGYHGLPEQTATDFNARLAGVEGSAAYLRTGDLGFLHGGELFICGRSKDLVVVRGRNHFPQDLERTAEGDGAVLRPGCCAAFAVTAAGGGSERLAIVAELRGGASQGTAARRAAVDTVRRVVARDHGVAVSAVVLLEERSVPKTTSGKIKRHACRRGFLDGTLSEVYRWVDGDGQSEGTGGNVIAVGAGFDPQVAAVARQIAAQVSSLVSEANGQKEGRPTPTVDVSATLDSLQIVQLNSWIVRRFGAEIDLQLFFDDATPRNIAGAIVAATGGRRVEENLTQGTGGAYGHVAETSGSDTELPALNHNNWASRPAAFALLVGCLIIAAACIFTMTNRNIGWWEQPRRLFRNEDVEQGLRVFGGRLRDGSEIFWTSFWQRQLPFFGAFTILQWGVRIFLSALPIVSRTSLHVVSGVIGILAVGMFASHDVDLLNYGLPIILVLLSNWALVITFVEPKRAAAASSWQQLCIRWVVPVGFLCWIRFWDDRFEKSIYLSMKMLSFNLDVCSRTKADKLPSPLLFAQYFAFLFYIPSWVSGVGLTFDSFCRQRDRQHRCKSTPPPSVLFCSATKLVAYGLLLETSLHIVYYPSVIFFTDLYFVLRHWERFSYIMLRMSFFFMAAKIRWDSGRLLALVFDGIDMPEDAPRCPLTISFSFTNLWRQYHASWSRWFATYIYIPLGGEYKGLLAVGLFSWLMHPSGGWFWNSWSICNVVTLTAEAWMRKSEACKIYAADANRRSAVVRGLNQALVLWVYAGLTLLFGFMDDDIGLVQSMLWFGQEHLSVFIFMVAFCILFQFARFGQQGRSTRTRNPTLSRSKQHVS